VSLNLTSLKGGVGQSYRVASGFDSSQAARQSKKGKQNMKDIDYFYLIVFVSFSLFIALYSP